MQELVNGIVNEIKRYAENHGVAERIVLHDVIGNLIGVSTCSLIEPIIIKNTCKKEKK